MNYTQHRAFPSDSLPIFMIARPGKEVLPISNIFYREMAALHWNTSERAEQ